MAVFEKNFIKDFVWIKLRQNWIELFLENCFYIFQNIE